MTGQATEALKSAADINGMADHYLHASLQLPLVPVLSFIGGNGRPMYSIGAIR